MAMSSVVKPVGWSAWSSTDPRTDQFTFAEYGSTGDGAARTRADFAMMLSVVMRVRDVLGSGYANEWFVDTSYM